MRKFGIRSGLLVRCGAMVGRMACMFAAGSLICASVAQGQVIEEGGFPVKGGGVSGEAFSLSCPSRLVVQAGSSIVLSCSATAVPEEGVRYEWELLSGDGLHLLSSVHDLSPLFTASLSGVGEEYAYRLTAMSVGVYETADVTVSVEGFPGDEARGRGEGSSGLVDCSSFAFTEGDREGCFSKDEESQPFAPFEGFPGEEGGSGFPALGPFGVPGEDALGFAGGGAPVPQTAPYLDCPPAVFLEELEVGSIECHAADAMGEEFLEYMWEPVGSTTRDYLDNPRLIPEDAPNPSVVAPEAPVYETLESFRSGETTFRYRYRLTATSRATGLSSFSEVEVFVSGSRPSVYCPEEVVVEEGATIALDCEGVDPLSGRMDYDKDGASIEWEWSGLWGTSTGLLDGTDLSSPLFTAPAGSAGKEYHYIASMTSSSSGAPLTARRKVTARVTAGEAGRQAATDASALADKGSAPVITCEDSEVYEGAENIELDCSVTEEPSDPTYAWTARDPTSDTSLLTNTDSLRATFSVPDNVDGDTDYEYRVTLSAAGIDDVSADIIVTVLEKPNIWCRREDHDVPLLTGGTHRIIPCPGGWANAPDSDYVFKWMGVETVLVTPEDALARLDQTNVASPLFSVPTAIPTDDWVFYTYSLTVSATNADPFTLMRIGVTVSVQNRPELGVTCDDPADVYEGDSDFALNCEPDGAWRGFTYTWQWSPIDKLMGHDTGMPMFAVPDDVDQDTTYEYRARVSAQDHHPDEATVTVTVKDMTPAITCENIKVYEKATAHITLGCSVVNEPAGATYAWAPRGSTSDTDDLSSTTILKPAFSVPEDINELHEANKDYEYTVTLSAGGIDDVSEDVTVTVLEKPNIVLCTEMQSVSSHFGYEGAGRSEARFSVLCPDGPRGAPEIPPGTPPVYTYVWSTRGNTPATALAYVTSSNMTVWERTYVLFPEVPSNMLYKYRLTMSAPNADDAIQDLDLDVRNKPQIKVTCANTPYESYEDDDDIILDCEASGAPTGSTYTWSWSPDSYLTDYDTAMPTFAVPDDVDRDTTYTYTVTASAENSKKGVLDVTVTVKDTGTDIVVRCRDTEVYEGADDFELGCSVSNEPSGATYSWAARGSTSDTSLLTSGADTLTPMFSVPIVDTDTDYEYTVTLSADGVADIREDVTVTVKAKPDITVSCPGNPYRADEGDSDIILNCSASGVPPGSSYAYAWTERGSTPDTALLTGDTNGPAPTFDVPTSVIGHQTYEYTLTVSAGNANSGAFDVTVTVRDKAAPVVTCDNPEVYEGTDDFELGCSVANEPSGATYSWAARGSTSDTSLLTIGANPLTPTFSVPIVDTDTDYEYTVTLSVPSDIGGVTADVTVTVIDTNIDVACYNNPYVADEGDDDITLDCEASGAPGDTPLALDPSYVYVWTARGSTADTALLTGDTEGPTPMFDVPSSVDEDGTYEYTLTVSADNAQDGDIDVMVTVKNTVDPPVVTCSDPDDVYEGSDDIDLACSVQNEPSGATYSWAARGSTSDTSLLTIGANPLTPTFSVPPTVNADTDYEYSVTLSASGIAAVTAEVTVRVLNKQALDVSCAPPSPVFEGSPDFDLDCVPSGAPAGSEYDYVWTARGSTADTALLTGDTNGPAPTFSVPVSVNADETYEYLLTISAENAEDATAEVMVTVLNLGVLNVSCASPPLAYEGSGAFTLDCVASGALGDNPAYAWTERGNTPNTAQLIAGTDGPAPTFEVPETVDEDETYEYLLTVSAENAVSASAEVAVTVLNKKALAVSCASPPLVYEGSEDLSFDCSVSGAPAGSTYDYVWMASGSTPDTALLTGANSLTPTFLVPNELPGATTYEYTLTASAENAESAMATVTVTVLNRGALAVSCTSPPLVYEGSEDFAFDCSASGAPAGSAYEYAWTARGNTADTALLMDSTPLTPTFLVPDDLPETTTYEYLLTASAENAEDATAEVTVTVLNRGALAVVCTETYEVYEGSEDFPFDCSASGAPAGSAYEYAWTARGNTADTALLMDSTPLTPTFLVPDDLPETTTYEYLLTVSAENAEDATAEVTVTVLNRGALAVVCTETYEVYEGSEDFPFDCSASGAPAGSAYEYAWTARGNTADTALLMDSTPLTPTFLVPDDLPETTTYEYLLTVSAENAEDATAEVTVTVLDRPPLAFVDDAIVGRVYVFTVGEAVADILLPEATGGLSPYAYTLTPVLPEGLALDDPTRTISGTPLEVSPRMEYAWQTTDANSESVSLAFFIEVVPAADITSPPVAESSPEAAESSSLEVPEPSSVGVTVSTSSLRFGVQSADTEVSLDPLTDQISTYISGPYHAGRMTLSPGGGGEALEDAEDMALSIELASPVVLRREEGVEDASIVLSPNWSRSESCEQLSSQAIGGLYTETTLSEGGCRLLRFGGELDLTAVPLGRYVGSMDIVLRSGESEETYSVEVDVTVVPAQRVITIGPGGVRFSTSRELPAGLTEEQNLSIYPDIAFLTEEKPHGVFELSNPSLVPLEVSVSARFGYTEVTADGREVVVGDASGSHLGDLSSVVDIHPGVAVLQPGEKGLVRYGIEEGALAAMAEKGYAAFFDVVSSPRQYVRTDRMPEEVTGDRTARVTMRVPGVYVPGEGASQLRATLLSISYVGSLSATFLLETQDHPFVGEVLAYDGEGRELGRRETLVYTRSRVRIPLDRIPEGGAVFLRFAPRGSDRVPLPASVPWDAPRRDIGGIEDK